MADENYEVRADVLTDEDIFKVAPFLRKHPKLFRGIKHFFAIDKVNWLHSLYCFKPTQAEVAGGMAREMDVKLDIDGVEVLDHLPEGPFITVSNHPFGAWDGILLIAMMSERRPDFKVLVNMILNQISGLRKSFIAVDALGSDDPAKKAVSMRGIKEAIRHVKAGHPLGFFPAGAVGKLKLNGHIEDREWQPNVARIIEKCDVPVIPIFFHGRNSAFFTFLGLISWKLRTLRLPSEVFRRRGDTVRVSVGNPIPVEEQKKHQESPEAFAAWLKSQTYALRSR